MKCKKYELLINDLIDNCLSGSEKEKVKTHLSECNKCNKYYNSLNLIKNKTAELPDEISPDENLWNEIEKQISKTNQIKIYQLNNSLKTNYYSWLAAASVVLIFLFYYLFQPVEEKIFWKVSDIVGEIEIGGNNIKKEGNLMVGEWLETGNDNRAKINVALIGEIEVESNSRLQLLNSEENEKRINLNKGKINATIWAPPRVFIVETPSTTAIDLGCVYTLEVLKDSSTILEVISGWVALTENGNDVIVPSGAVCKSIKNKGNGTPYFKDASELFISNLFNYDFENQDIEILKAIISESRDKDALSLWHLILKSDNKERELIVNRLIEIEPLPYGVTINGVLEGNRAMLDKWWEYLGFGSKKLFDYL